LRLARYSPPCENERPFRFERVRNSVLAELDLGGFRSRGVGAGRHPSLSGRGALARMIRREHQHEVSRLLGGIADLAGRIEGRRARGARAAGLVEEQRSLEKIRAELRELLGGESFFPARSNGVEDVIDHSLPVLLEDQGA
jgi:hypothetical protein